jgi:hypothetical protein
MNKLLSFRHKSVLAGDQNAKHPFWYIAVSNLPDEEVMDLIGGNEFEISAPQCPTYYSPEVNCDLLDILVQWNNISSCVIASGILCPHHLTGAFHVLNYVKTKNLSEPAGNRN